jgi:hypothetical protein
MISHGHETARQKRAAEYARLRDDEDQEKAERMQRGPYLDGALLVIPSDWYKEAAKEVWKKAGCRFRKTPRSWTRHTNAPAWPDGERTFYTAQQWLAWAISRFDQFYPGVRQEVSRQPS